MRQSRRFSVLTVQVQPLTLQSYLAAVSPEWKAGPGVDKSIKWPTAATGAGGKGNEGVASNVTRAKNSIGYVEYAYANKTNVAYTAKNAAGNFVNHRLKALPLQVMQIGKVPQALTLY